MKWMTAIVFLMLALMTVAYVSRTMTDRVQQQIVKPEAGHR
jgi:hypothetical protein